jgi:hypothetical protein
MRAAFSRFGLIVCTLSFLLSFGSSCSTAESKTATTPATTSAVTAESAVAATTSSRGPTIEIKPNSPADTVRVFYRNLREKKFRDAIFLTNLRPAIEGLTDAELKEFEVDFEAIAKFVPSQLQINGEIITGDSATVTAKLPNEDLDGEEIQEIKLRKEGNVWIILTVDESAEKRIKQDGKNYFPNLRIETHHDEARDMLDRVAKAQMAFATQNQGQYGDMESLIKGGLLPADIRSSVSTGYVYTVTVTPDRKRYAASAVPAVPGKTGRLSYAVELDKGGQPRLIKRDPSAKTK